MHEVDMAAVLLDMFLVGTLIILWQLAPVILQEFPELGALPAASSDGHETQGSI